MGGVVSAKVRTPNGRPIPGITNLGDVEWALRRAQIYLSDGGDSDNVAFVEFLNGWLDYRLDIIGTPLEHVATSKMRTMRPRVSA
jgi:hypothetical protein